MEPNGRRDRRRRIVVLPQTDPTPLDPTLKPAGGLLHKTISFEHFELTPFEKLTGKAPSFYRQ